MRPLRRDEAQWLFPASSLHQTPSQECGMSYEEELQKRARTIDFMRSLAARAGLTKEEDERFDNGGRAKGVLTVASTLVHRFYMRRTLRDFPPDLMAPTILFIASKIEEEPLKLRHIVNHCLAKFLNLGPDKFWLPENDHSLNSQPGPCMEYKRWEADILAAEEVTHEALCFDMTVDQPWTILYHAIRDWDGLWLDPEAIPRYKVAEVKKEEEAEEGEVEETPDQNKRLGRSNGNGIGSGISDGVISRSLVGTQSWVLLNELYLYPISVLFHPRIIAFSCLFLVTLLLSPDDNPSYLIQLAPLFGLQMGSNGKEREAEGDDSEAVESCIQQITEFAGVELKIKDLPILKEVFKWLPDPPDIASPVKRRFIASLAPTTA